MNIITQIKEFINPETKKKETLFTSQVNLNLIATYFDYEFMKSITDGMADKAVKEIWKVHGASIVRKVDKKTIGNLTVKKLSALIAKELK